MRRAYLWLALLVVGCSGSSGDAECEPGSACVEDASTVDGSRLPAEDGSRTDAAVIDVRAADTRVHDQERPEGETPADATVEKEGAVIDGGVTKDATRDGQDAIDSGQTPDASGGLDVVAEAAQKAFGGACSD